MNEYGSHREKQKRAFPVAMTHTPAEAANRSKARALPSEFWAYLHKIWQKPRVRIVFWAALTGLLIGPTGIAQPAEDMLRGARWALQEKKSDGDLVVVHQDTKTLDELGKIDVNRADDAEVLSRLFSAGASRVFFDRAFATHGEKHDDEKFINELKAHPGRVFLGAFPAAGKGGNYAGKLPLKEFREHARVVSLLLYYRPFNLNVRLPLSSDSPIGKIPSLSAKIAGIKGSSDRDYSPDFSIRVNSFPSVSYVDVMRGRFNSAFVRDKTILIIPTSVTFNDIHSIPGQRIDAA
ncbi:CHASE2 domain-containing protein, partial [Novosphingobium sp.]|uniref:CHASE2 domain-containing protein n=1 Tax=Novosphingobium sp. TaxID=1874826 RepID=UPI002B46ACC1